MSAKSDLADEKVVIPLKGSPTEPQKMRFRLHEHKHKIHTPLLLFIIIVLGVFLAGGSLFYIQNKAYIAQKLAQDEEPSFSVDHLLLKILLREKEAASQEIRIMNIADYPQEFRLESEGVEGLVDIDSREFSLDPGQTKVVKAIFKTYDVSKGIEQQPGIYIGNLEVRTKESQAEVPVIIEIESANVLFDANLNPVSLERAVERGRDFVVEVRLFNLQSIDAEKVDMEYEVKDIRGNTLITESETVVVKTQASFFKTVSIPKNLAAGTYVFGAQTTLGSSKGTSSYLLEVIDPAQSAGALGILEFCQSDPLCSGLSISLLILLAAIGAYFYLFLGAFFYERLSGFFPGQKQTRKEVFIEKKGWFASLAEERRKIIKDKSRRQIEEREQKIKLKIEQEKLKIQKRKQRLEMIRLLFFGSKEKEKAIDKAALLAIERKANEGKNLLKKGNLASARKQYESVMKAYHSLGMPEKKASYSMVTSLYQELVKAENEHHELKNEEELRQQNERLALEEQKRLQQEEQIQAKKALLDERRSQQELLRKQEREQKEAILRQKQEALQESKLRKAKILEEQREARQKALELRREQKDGLAKEREQMMNLANEQKRSELQERLAKKADTLREEENHLDKIEEEKAKVIAHLSHARQEFEGLIAKLGLHEEEFGKKRLALDESRKRIAAENARKEALASFLKKHGKEREELSSLIHAREKELISRIKKAPKREREMILREFRSKKKSALGRALEIQRQDESQIKSAREEATKAQREEKRSLLEFTRAEKEGERIRKSLFVLQTEIHELMQRRASMENAAIAQRRMLAKMRG
ncbi:MAG TPA: hypothetical protein VJB12_02585, partial [Candidatus Nanoarchaeia archaeon]|nr:hypothetical protein [Candidatus Nanoarchaeia archaeon]